MNEQFQFHKGTIRTYKHVNNLAADLYFNSIKVRLEHDAFSAGATGATDFNSIKVRLER